MLATLILSNGFTLLGFADDYYAMTEHQLESNRGNTYSMMTITKVPDKDTCEKVANQKSPTNGPWISSGKECVAGQEWDEQFEKVFANQPGSGLYVSFVDLNGYETRVKWMRLTGSNSPVPGFPIDLPTEGAVLWAKELMKVLEVAGTKNAKIIYPTKRK